MDTCTSYRKADCVVMEACSRTGHWVREALFVGSYVGESVCVVRKGEGGKNCVCVFGDILC